MVKLKKLTLFLTLIFLIALFLGKGNNVQSVFKFKDIVGHRFELEIIKLSNAGIISGYPDGTFKPDENIKRSELAVVLGKLKGLENEANKFKTPSFNCYDMNSIPKWALPFFDLGFNPKHNFLTGRSGYFAPNDFATRGEVAYGVYLIMNPPKYGGTLKVAVFTNPATLDTHTTTAIITAEIGMHIFETLFTYDESGQAIPLLVESYEISNDIKSYTFKLRKGVLFHNGKEMTSEDVKLSIERWGRLSSTGKSLFSRVESFNIIDKYTLELKLKEPLSTVPTYLASELSVPAIYPKEVIEKVGDTPLKFSPDELIGTGPFKFVEFVFDDHIKLIRFEKYVPRIDIPNGLGGRRTVYPDTLLFNIVPDNNVRMLGVTTNLYDFAEDISPDQYGKLRTDPKIMTKVALKGWEASVFNKKQDIMTNIKIRQAFLAALNMEECMKGTFGNPDFYKLGPHLMSDTHIFYTKSGKEYYNQKNTELAKKLLKEAGYKGEPIRWLVSPQYADHYNIALIAKDQLEKAGFVIDLQVVDWATFLKRRTDPSLWDVFSTHFTFLSDPTFIFNYQSNLCWLV